MNKHDKFFENKWKWFDFTNFVILPVSLLVLVIILFVLILQLFSAFSLEILLLTLFILIYLLSVGVVMYGFKNYRKYGIVMYFIIRIVSLVLNDCLLQKNILMFVCDVIIFLLELVYYSKRFKYKHTKRKNNYYNRC